MLDIVEKWVPYTYEAFVNYRKDAINLSKTAVSAVQNMLKGNQVTQENSGMSKREWDEFSAIFLK